MRIISGKYKGRNLDGISIDGTRPTMDRVKESMFASIQGKIKNSICLDLFAGSGSLGIEAISNGSKFCYFVDNNKIAVKTIQKNIDSIKIKEYTNIMQSDFNEALYKYHNSKVKFDIIFLDPPYSLNLINSCLDKIVELNLLNKDGIVVCEYENELVDNDKLTLIREKKYGTKTVRIYKYDSL